MYPNDRPKTSFGDVHAHDDGCCSKRPIRCAMRCVQPSAPKNTPARGRDRRDRLAPGGHNEGQNAVGHRVLGYAALAPCPRNRSNTFCSARPAQPGRESPYPTTPVFGEAVPPDDAPSTVPTTICIYGIEWFGVGKYARLLLPGVFEVPWGPPSGRTYSS